VGKLLDGQPSPSQAEPAERIRVEEEERERQHHARCLGEEAGGEGTEREGIEAWANPWVIGHGAKPRPGGEEIPHAAQHVAALGDPGHRLDTEGMDGKDERGEGGSELHGMEGGAATKRGERRRRAMSRKRTVATAWRKILTAR
jgi:hypothetical protein